MLFVCLSFSNFTYKLLIANFHENFSFKRFICGYGRTLNPEVTLSNLDNNFIRYIC